MLVPKRKVSKTRRNKRRAHHALGLPALVMCSRTRVKHLPHRACRKERALYYKGVCIVPSKRKVKSS